MYKHDMIINSRPRSGYMIDNFFIYKEYDHWNVLEINTMKIITPPYEMELRRDIIKFVDYLLSLKIDYVEINRMDMMVKDTLNRIKDFGRPKYTCQHYNTKLIYFTRTQDDLCDICLLKKLSLDIFNWINNSNYPCIMGYESYDDFLQEHINNQYKLHGYNLTT